MDSSPRREEVNLHEVIQKSFPQILIKDLAEYERICPVCNGLGMRIEDNIYGIKGDTSEAGRRYHFPYKHQALSFCRSCYNGVQRLCPYCREPYKNQAYLHCDCEGQKKTDREKKDKEREERFAKAVVVNEKDVDTMLYCEEWDKYYDTVDNFFDDYACNYEEDDNERPVGLWVCSVEKIHIDADNVVDNACEELHEDAYEQCDISSLQNLLDDWCQDQTGTTTYYPCYKQYVEINWSEYEDCSK